MKKIMLLCAIVCGITLAIGCGNGKSASVPGQIAVFKAVVDGADATGMNLHLKPMNIGAESKTVKLNVNGNNVECEIETSTEGFYTIYGVRNGAQLILPFYQPYAEDLANMKIVFSEDGAVVDTDNNNRAMSAMYNFFSDSFKKLFSNEGAMSKEERENFVEHFSFVADSISKKYKCDEKVDEYLKIWAFTTSKDILGTKPEGAVKVLDNPMALYFPYSAPHIIMSTFPKGDMDARLEYLNANYKCEPLKRYIVERELDRYISSFVSTPATYPQGLETVTAVVEKYNLDKSNIETFKTRKAPAEGKPFPTDAKLFDAKGNAMNVEQFRGKYIYVDLWASWCGPCCKEVPSLQKLEKELHGSPVVFLSISIDQDEDAWKAKMADLKMGGNQWISKDKKLSETFDVQGIPRFLIFDKEGKLIVNKATRPSDPQTKALLQSLK